MLDALTTTDLVAHSKALEAAGTAIRLVMRVPAPLKSIADQVIRSASSVPANLAEGHGRAGRDRLQFWRIAYASAKEVDSHLRLLAATGAISSSAAQAALDRFDQVRAMTWCLINPKARSSSGGRRRGTRRGTHSPGDAVTPISARRIPPYPRAAWPGALAAAVGSEGASSHGGSSLIRTARITNGRIISRIAGSRPSRVANPIL